MTPIASADFPGSYSLEIVLARPRLSANVGAVARVAANFNSSGITVVTDDSDWIQHTILDRETPEAPSVEARRLAVGAAAEYLDRLRVVSTVQQAVSSCTIAVGFTRRSGEHRQSTLELAQLASLIRHSHRTHSIERPAKIALVFGNEETGLTDDELMPCSHFCQIPTGGRLPSMNLSHAVAVVMARLFDDLARLEDSPRTTESGRVTRGGPAPMAEMHSFFEHWRELLTDSGLTGAGNPDRLSRRLERLFYRLQPTLREVRLIRGILSKAQYWIRRGRSSS